MVWQLYYRNFLLLFIIFYNPLEEHLLNVGNAVSSLVERTLLTCSLAVDELKIERGFMI